MKRFFLLALAVAVALGDSASAQNLRQPFGNNSIDRYGITVYAVGTATAPADSAVVSINVNGPHLNQAALQRIAAAMVQAGMEPNSVEVPPYMQFSGAQSNYVLMSGIVRHPSREKMTAAVPVIGFAFARENLTIPTAQIDFRLDDCAAAMERAQGEALRIARDQAARLARVAGLRLGAIDGIVFNSGVTQACETMTFLPVHGPDQQDPTKDMTVHVNAAVTVHFATAATSARS